MGAGRQAAGDGGGRPADPEGGQPLAVRGACFVRGGQQLLLLGVAAEAEAPAAVAGHGDADGEAEAVLEGAVGEGEAGLEGAGEAAPILAEAAGVDGRDLRGKHLAASRLQHTAGGGGGGRPAGEGGDGGGEHEVHAGGLLLPSGQRGTHHLHHGAQLGLGLRLLLLLLGEQDLPLVLGVGGRPAGPEGGQALAVVGRPQAGRRTAGGGGLLLRPGGEGPCGAGGRRVGRADGPPGPRLFRLGTPPELGLWPPRHPVPWEVGEGGGQASADGGGGVSRAGGGCVGLRLGGGGPEGGRGLVERGAQGAGRGGC